MAATMEGELDFLWLAVSSSTPHLFLSSPELVSGKGPTVTGTDQSVGWREWDGYWGFTQCPPSGPHLERAWFGLV